MQQDLYSRCAFSTGRRCQPPQLGAINAAREMVEPAVLPQLGAINAARERVEPAVLPQLGAINAAWAL